MTETVRAEEVVRHLMFHKAIIGDDEDGARIDSYIGMAQAKTDGEHVGISDPFDRAIALAFELVLEEQMDPWRIDLMRFVGLYMKRVQEQTEVDLITAGRLLHMAWTILKLQSDNLKQRAEPPPAPIVVEEDPWFGQEATDFDDPSVKYTETVIGALQAPIDEKVRHKGDRKVTFMELLSALEEARREAELRITVNSEREKERAVRRARNEARVEGQVHKEDQEADIADTWAKIAGLNGAPIPITSIQERSRDDLVKTFVSLLFLARQNRIRLWQDDFPYGMIYVQNAAHAPEREVPATVVLDTPKRKPPVRKAKKQDPSQVTLQAERFSQN